MKKSTPGSKTLEQMMQELEEINQKLLDQEMNLEASMVLYRRGMALYKECSTLLENARLELEIIQSQDRKDESDEL